VRTTACGGDGSGEEAAVDEHAKLKTNRGDAQNITRDPKNITFTYYSRKRVNLGPTNFLLFSSEGI
jgi:hypothetical protein